MSFSTFVAAIWNFTRIVLAPRVEKRLRNEVNTYTFIIPWKKANRTTLPSGKLPHNLPPQREGEKTQGLREEIQNLQKGLRWCTPGSEPYEATVEKIARLRPLMEGKL